MEAWFKTSMLLCVFGFFKEFLPSEPFVFEFMSGPWSGVMEEEVIQKVSPVATYSYLLHLLLASIGTDFMRYKAPIVFMGVYGIINWSMLICSTSLLHLQIAQAMFGAFMSCNVAYYTYIYAQVDSEYYLKVSSHTTAASLAGRALSGVLAQILISFKLMNYKELNYITLSAMFLATCWALFLPKVQRSIYFHQSNSSKMSIKGAFALMKTHFTSAFSDAYVLKWSAWTALTTAGFIQMQSYIQALWSVILVEETDVQIYNGAVEAASTFLGFLSVVLAGYLKIDWKGRGDFILTICSGGIAVLSSQTQHVWVSYVCYALYCAMFQFMVTIASAEIAECIVEDSYGLVFGINSFVGLVVQTVITLAFVEETGLALSPRSQHLVYGIYHFLIAVLFMIIAMVTAVKRARLQKQQMKT